jgi:hypothetical protein
MKEKEALICPFCEEGALVNVKCRKCGKAYLRCDECGSIFKDRDTLDEDYGSECPHCSAQLEDE